VIVLEFPEQGRRLTRFLSYDIDASFFLPPHRFTFQLADVRGFNDLFELTKPLTPVNVYQDEDFVLSGVILDQEIEDDDTIRIQGLDHTYRLDGTLDPANPIPPDTALLEALKRQVAPFGFTEVLSDNNELRQAQCSKAPAVTAAKPTRKVTREKINAGDKAWSLVNRLAAKYGYYVQPGVSGSKLALAKPEYNQGPTFRLKRFVEANTSGNNVLSRTVSRGYQGVPTYVQGFSRGGDARERLVGQKAQAQLEAQIQAHTEIAAILGQRAVFTKFKAKGGSPIPGLIESGTQKIYNPLFIQDHHTTDGFELENRLNREFVEYFRNTLVVRCTVPDHAQDGATFAPDTIVDYIDEAAGLVENLYLAERSFSLSGDQETTRLTLIRPQTVKL
jgi:prophage tail gpP-like protein